MKRWEAFLLHFHRYHCYPALHWQDVLIFMLVLGWYLFVSLVSFQIEIGLEEPRMTFHFILVQKSMLTLQGLMHLTFELPSPEFKGFRESPPSNLFPFSFFFQKLNTSILFAASNLPTLYCKLHDSEDSFCLNTMKSIWYMVTVQ